MAGDATLDTPLASPISSQERIVCIDALRGVAVLGILVMNVYAFAMPFMAYSNPLLMGGTDPLNMGVWFFTHIFFDQKFLSIFAILFGAGLIVMSGRAEAKGVSFGRIFYRRQFWLLVIGMVHAYIIWFGDILFHYALVGMIAYLFRNRSPKALIVIACLILPVALLASYGGGVYVDDLRLRAGEIVLLQEQGTELSDEQEKTLEELEEMDSFLSPSEEDLREDVTAYKGRYADALAFRVPVAVMMQTQAIFAFSIWRVGGLMLIGMAFMKLGIVSGERSSSFYRKFALIGYGLGLPIMIFSALNAHAHQFDELYMFRIGMLPNYIGSILVAFGHIGIVMLIVKVGVLQKTMARFAAVGRMAITNYLMHSIILTTVFYGYGLGLYAEVPRIGQMGFVIAVIVLQLVLSPWWLNRYRFGPVEWLWRSQTYWKRQPMRR